MRAPAAVLGFGLGQLYAVVHALHFSDFSRLEGRNAALVLHCQCQNVRQVILALGVARLECLQPAFEQARGGDHDTGVDLLDLAFFRSGIGFLDDARWFAVLAAHDASVTGRIGKSRAEQSQTTRRRGAQQLAQRFTAQQRHIAVQHQHAVGIGDFRHRLRHGVSGTELLIL